MAPVLENGQRVTVRSLSLYVPGDIIVFSDDFGQLLAHRLLGIYLKKGTVHYLTQADNAPRADKGITRRQIVGKITRPVSLSKRLYAMGRFMYFTGKWITARAIR